MVFAFVVAVAALLVGVFVGWAVTVRGPARWCGWCGDSLRCLTCSPVTATGRATVSMRQPQSSTVDRPLMTPLAAQRAPDVQSPRRRRTL